MNQHLRTTESNQLAQDAKDRQHNQSMWIKDHKTGAKDDEHDSLYVSNPQLKK